MLPLDMRPIIDMFLSKIYAYDETGAVVDYRRRDPVVGADYWFAGTIIPPTDTDLQMLDAGDIKAGVIIVYTRGKELFYIDAQATPSTSQKQTYVKWDGDVYRVKGDSNRWYDGLHRKYIAVRRVER